MSKWLKQWDDEVDLDIFDTPYYYKWWSVIKINAAIIPKFTKAGGYKSRVRITYGEWAVTITSLRRQFNNCDDGAVLTFLQTLIDEGLISLRKSGQALVISILNFERFYSNMPPGGEPDFDPSLYENQVDAAPQSLSQLLNEPPNETGSQPPNVSSSVLPDETINEPRSESAGKTPNSNNIDEREKRKNSQIDINAREEEFFEKLKASDLTIEWMQSGLRIEKEVLLSLLEEFYLYSISTDQFHPDFSQFKNHFMNWARKQNRENNIQTQKTTNYGKRSSKSNSGSSRAADRRGADGTGISVDDYSKPLPD